MWRQDIDMTMASQSSFINWLHNITYESGAPPYRKWAHEFLFNYCIDSEDEMHSLQGFAIILYIYSSSICHRKLFNWLRCGRVFNNATPLQPMFSETTSVTILGLLTQWAGLWCLIPDPLIQCCHVFPQCINIRIIVSLIIELFCFWYK